MPCFGQSTHYYMCPLNRASTLPLVVAASSWRVFLSQVERRGCPERMSTLALVSLFVSVQRVRRTEGFFAGMRGLGDFFVYFHPLISQSWPNSRVF